MSKVVLTAEKEKELMGENFFYEHGLDPSLKNLVQMQAENLYYGVRPNARTPVKERPRKLLFANRDIKDFMKRELNCNSVLTTLPWWSLSLIICSRICMGFSRFYPVGEYGIRSFKQTNAFKVWGYPGLVVAYATVFSSYYLLFNTSCYMTRMVYERVILQDRDYVKEFMKFYNPHAPYYFEDSPLALSANIPNEARLLMAQKSAPFPETVEKILKQ
jgi:hypothetical protein